MYTYVCAKRDILHTVCTRMWKEFFKLPITTTELLACQALLHTAEVHNVIMALWYHIFYETSYE